MIGPPHAPLSRRGLAYGVAAFGLWGFMPIYIKAVGDVPVLEVLSHRIVWALVVLLGLSAAQGRLAAVLAALRPGRTLAVLAVSTTALALNWLVYIWAVGERRILEASLGYYINPLVNVLLGVVIFKERLERPVRVAILVAAIGVLWLAVHAGQPPWIALALASSFGLYGLMRKLAAVDAISGLVVEALLMLPLAGGYLVWTVVSGHSAFLSGGPSRALLLLLAGPVTAIPLLFFAGAARRLPLSALGFLQYLSPTLSFMLAVLVYGEPFDRVRVVAFAIIWTALAIFAVHSARRGQPEPVTVPE